MKDLIFWTVKNIKTLQTRTLTNLNRLNNDEVLIDK